MLNEEQALPCLWVWLMDASGTPSLAVTLPNGTIAPAFILPEPQLMLKFKRDTDAAYERFIPKPVRDAMELLEDYNEDTPKIDPPPETPGIGGVPVEK